LNEAVHGSAGSLRILGARQARNSILRFNPSPMFRGGVIVIVALLALTPFDLSRRYRITH
jgi:hypothetical protein